RAPGDEPPGGGGTDGRACRRPGWAWTRNVRRHDQYERILDRLGVQRRAIQRDDERDAVTG
ncbi:MAG TPA: hypothetical protein VE127_12440, partial [Solirubrobacteraceae bacterium]|nr:hypothetical protein [Solirubrobacteraceae bacterium]